MPVFSILTPVYKPNLDYFQQCVNSVLNQTMNDWEFCLVADGPQPKEVTNYLNSLSDPRIKVRFRESNGGISAATNDALEMSSAEFIVLLDNDDLFAEHALGTCAWEIDKFDDVDFVFSDEDHLDYKKGKRVGPFFKPGFSVDRLRQQMYLGHILICRRDLAVKVGGFRSDFDGAQDHDLALRVIEKARRVLHIPQILYHWRESPTSTAMDAGAKGWAYEAGVKAVTSHLERTGFQATASMNLDWPGIVNLHPKLDSKPKVSIVIPSGMTKRTVRGKEVPLIDLALQSIIEVSSYQNFEIVVVIDKRTPEDTAQYLKEFDQLGRIKIVKDNRDFNFSKACNLGVSYSQGEYLILHNDDTEIIQPDWIERMLMYATEPDIGAVGVKLLYGDGLINHSGIWAKEGDLGHRYRGYHYKFPGYLASLASAQNCIAVTGACLMVERTKYDLVGGLSTIFPLAYNDVDLCLKLNRSGYRSIVDCATAVLHHESSTRDPTVEDWEMDLVHDRWKPILHHDPYMNPNFMADGVEEWPTPTDSVIHYLERRGESKHEARAWPAEDEYFYVGY